MELGKGTLLAKIDIKSAYRVVPVHPEDRPLLGMKFQGRTYADATLPFGVRSAPKIFNAVADALLWILKAHGVSNIMHYLDDFITLGTPGSSQCESNRLIMSGLCELLGMPLAVDKCEGPTTLLGFLGFLLDTNNMTVSLPQEKLDRIASLIHKWLDRRSCTKSELESLIGQLQHASTACGEAREVIPSPHDNPGQGEAQPLPLYSSEPEFQSRPHVVAHVPEGLEWHIPHVSPWPHRAYLHISLRCLWLLGMWGLLQVTLVPTPVDTSSQVILHCLPGVGTNTHCRHAVGWQVG